MSRQFPSASEQASKQASNQKHAKPRARHQAQTATPTSKQAASHHTQQARKRTSTRQDTSKKGKGEPNARGTQHTAAGLIEKLGPGLQCAIVRICRPIWVRRAHLIGRQVGAVGRQVGAVGRHGKSLDGPSASCQAWGRRRTFRRAGQQHPSGSTAGARNLFAIRPFGPQQQVDLTIVDRIQSVMDSTHPPNCVDSVCQSANPPSFVFYRPA